MNAAGIDPPFNGSIGISTPLITVKETCGKTKLPLPPTERGGREV
jgi:hypothetical protein